MASPTASGSQELSYQEIVARPRSSHHLRLRLCRFIKPATATSGSQQYGVKIKDRQHFRRDYGCHSTNPANGYLFQSNVELDLCFSSDGHWSEQLINRNGKSFVDWMRSNSMYMQSLAEFEINWREKQEIEKKDMQTIIWLAHTNRRPLNDGHCPISFTHTLLADRIVLRCLE